MLVCLKLLNAIFILFGLFIFILRISWTSCEIWFELIISSSKFCNVQSISFSAISSSFHTFVTHNPFSPLFYLFMNLCLLSLLLKWGNYSVVVLSFYFFLGRTIVIMVNTILINSWTFAPIVIFKQLIECVILLIFFLIEVKLLMKHRKFIVE